MANAKIYDAKIKSSGAPIRVYKLRNGNWCNADDCKTEYSEKDLDFK